MTPWASLATDEMGRDLARDPTGVFFCAVLAGRPRQDPARLRRNEVLELVHRDLRVDRSADRLQSRGKDILVKALRVPA